MKTKTKDKIYQTAFFIVLFIGLHFYAWVKYYEMNDHTQFNARSDAWGHIFQVWDWPNFFK